MSEGVTLITATGMRPEALALCAQFVSRQTYEPLQWIVVDDGDVSSVIDRAALPPSTLLTDFYPKPSWKPGDNTLARNILAALPEVKYDVVLFIEDDDWYDKDYVNTQVNRMGDNAIVGEVPAFYYHFPTSQYRVLDNFTHASLCQTGIRRELFPLLESICEEQSALFIDVRLWAGVRAHRALARSRQCVGMKGLPGRAGIGIGHRPEAGGPWKQDTADRMTLRQWIGEDVKLYTDRFKASEAPGGYKPLGNPLATRPSDPQTPRNDSVAPSESAKPISESVFTPPEPFPSQPDFEEFFFMGQRRYKCNQVWESGAPCEYDTYDLQALLQHIREPHNRSGKVSERVAKQRASMLVDPRGKPMTYDEPVSEEFSCYHFRKDL